MKAADEIVHVYVDAACNGDPGTCGCGIFLKHPDGSVDRHLIPVVAEHIHEAEFVALHEGLKLALHSGYQRGRFFTDSQLVDQAVNSGKVKNKCYQPLLHDILLESADFTLFIVKWIPSNANKEADRLAKRAIRERG